MSDAEENTALHELHHLERVAEDGSSGETPAILLGALWVVCALAVLVLTAVALLAYRLAA
jgi:hypothetical protein